METPTPIHFRGWIPTVSGRLSFSVFGHTLFPSRATCENVADPYHRYFTAYQQHDLSDVILPFKQTFSRFLLGRRGNCTLLVIARTEDELPHTQFYFSGLAFIFFDSNTWANRILPLLQEYNRHLSMFYSLTRATLHQHANSEFEKIIDICASHSSFFAEIKISRRGTTDIWVPVPNATAPDAPSLPTNEVRRATLLHGLAAQLFFFLKNLGHHHQHHDGATDTIVDIHEINNDDDLTWRRNTLYSMYRTVIEYKRNPHSATFNNCIGIIAYAETFFQLCLEEIPLAEGNPDLLPIYYGDNTTNSIRSTQAGVERQRSERSRRLDIVRTTLLTIIAISISFAGLVRLSPEDFHITPDPWLI